MRPVLMIGPPGSGKGTQAEMLAPRFNIPHISTGDLVREHIQQDDAIGSAVKEIVERGGLVPDNVMFEIVEKHLANEDCKNGYILDGFPRTYTQAVWYYRQLSSCPMVLLMDVSEEIILERAAGRGREDDKHIRERLKEYGKQTVPAVEYFARLNLVITIDGDLSITDVFTECELAIELDIPPSSCPLPQPSV